MFSASEEEEASLGWLFLSSEGMIIQETGAYISQVGAKCSRLVQDQSRTCSGGEVLSASAIRLW